MIQSFRRRELWKIYPFYPHHSFWWYQISTLHPKLPYFPVCFTKPLSLSSMKEEIDKWRAVSPPPCLQGTSDSSPPVLTGRLFNRGFKHRHWGICTLHQSPWCLRGCWEDERKWDIMTLMIPTIIASNIIHMPHVYHSCSHGRILARYFVNSYLYPICQSVED